MITAAVFLASVAAALLGMLLRRPSARNACILGASYGVYGCWHPDWAVLLAFSTLVTYACTGVLWRPGITARWRRFVLALSIAANLGLLVAFKYSAFLLESLGWLLPHSAHMPKGVSATVLLPAGISFYTFQSMGYSLDVYNRRVPAERSLLRYATFVAFFPQLIAGPIERAARFLPQVRLTQPWSWHRWNTAFYLIGLGVFKKFGLANNLDTLVGRVFTSSTPSSLDIYAAAFGFMSQLYLDISAYTDLARGVGKLFGFDLSINFRAPFLTRTPTDFWSRWHITMSAWFRDYLYAWLVKRNKHARHAPLLLTMTAVGLWHGAAWNYLFFGLFHALWMIAFLFYRRRQMRTIGVRSPTRFWNRTLSWIGFVHILALSGIIFRAESLSKAGWLLQHLWSGSGQVAGVLGRNGILLCFLAFPLCCAIQWLEERPGGEYSLLRLPTVPRALVYLIACFAFLALADFGSSEFVYAQF